MICMSLPYRLVQLVLPTGAAEHRSNATAPLDAPQVGLKSAVPRIFPPAEARAGAITLTDHCMCGPSARGKPGPSRLLTHVAKVATPRGPGKPLGSRAGNR